MEKLYSLKDKLTKELENYAGKDLNSSSLDIVMKMASAVKNLSKVIRMCEEDEEGYSNRGSYAYYPADPLRYGVEPGRDQSYRGSYARGRRGAPRDSMGRYSGEMGYSRHGDVADKLRELIDHAPDEQTKHDLEEIVRRIGR